MFSGIYSATSGMEADLYRMDVLSTNMANVDTPGYKKGVLTVKTFSDDLNQRIANLPEDEGVYVDDVVTDYSKGDATFTGRTLDLRIGAEGFFNIQTENGTTYTRNGSFSIDPTGNLITSKGQQVLGKNGPINLAGISDIKIDKNGNIVGDGLEVATLKISNFPKPYQMTRIEGSQFTPNNNAQPTDVNNPEIAQHYLESSNVASVGIVTEMVNMISVYRHYEACQKVVTIQDTILGKTVNEIARA